MFDLSAVARIPFPELVVDDCHFLPFDHNSVRPVDVAVSVDEGNLPEDSSGIGIEPFRMGGNSLSEFPEAVFLAGRVEISVRHSPFDSRFQVGGGADT